MTSSDSYYCTRLPHLKSQEVHIKSALNMNIITAGRVQHLRVSFCSHICVSQTKHFKTVTKCHLEEIPWRHSYPLWIFSRKQFPVPVFHLSSCKAGRNPVSQVTFNMGYLGKAPNIFTCMNSYTTGSVFS